MKRLTTPVEIGGVTVEKDVSQIYYAIRELEGIRRKLEHGSVNDVTISVCFDSKSKRKESDAGENTYKANRIQKLDQGDFDNIAFVKEILTEAGYNTYRIDGIEADDLVYSLNKHYKSMFDCTIIVTCDLDLGINVDESTALYRFKSTSGYSVINMENFERTLETELKCKVPYNAITLYKSTVGDKSDNIAGIKRFGPAAFDKLVNHLDKKNINWEECKEADHVYEVLSNSKDYLTEDQVNQAIESLGLVRPIEIPVEQMPAPTAKSSRESRASAYMKLNMQSLID